LGRLSFEDYPLRCSISGENSTLVIAGKTNASYLPKYFMKGEKKDRTKEVEEKELSFHLSAPGLNNPMDPKTQ
jgi:hypothetical protein